MLRFCRGLSGAESTVFGQRIRMVVRLGAAGSAAALPLGDVVPVFLQALPLKSDLAENIIVAEAMTLLLGDPSTASFFEGQVGRARSALYCLREGPCPRGVPIGSAAFREFSLQNGSIKRALKEGRRLRSAGHDGPSSLAFVHPLRLFRSSRGGTPELQTAQDAPWLHGSSLKMYHFNLDVDAQSAAVGVALAGALAAGRLGEDSDSTSMLEGALPGPPPICLFNTWYAELLAATLFLKHKTMCRPVTRRCDGGPRATDGKSGLCECGCGCRRDDDGGGKR
jgi:hypothetical protein